MKPVKLPKTLRIMAARTSANQKTYAKILDTTRVRIKNNTTTMMSELTSRKKLHSQFRHITNTGNMKRRG
jgi:hypothetical protein